MCVSSSVVARQQSRIVQLDPTSWEITCIGGGNGTFVNRRRITRTRLSHGDEVLLLSHAHASWYPLPCVPAVSRGRGPALASARRARSCPNERGGLRASLPILAITGACGWGMNARVECR